MLICERRATLWDYHCYPFGVLDLEYGTRSVSSTTAFRNAPPLPTSVPNLQLPSGNPAFGLGRRQNPQLLQTSQSSDGRVVTIIHALFTNFSTSTNFFILVLKVGMVFENKLNSMPGGKVFGFE